MAKSKTSTKGPDPSTGDLQVLIFQGSPENACKDASDKMQELSPEWSAHQIEFTKINNSTCQVSIRFKKDGNGTDEKCFVTTDRNKWKLTNVRNHPVIAFGQTAYYFGVAPRIITPTP